MVVQGWYYGSKITGYTKSIYVAKIRLLDNNLKLWLFTTDEWKVKLFSDKFSKIKSIEIYTVDDTKESSTVKGTKNQGATNTTNTQLEVYNHLVSR